MSAYRLKSGSICIMIPSDDSKINVEYVKTLKDLIVGLSPKFWLTLRLKMPYVE